MLIFNRPKLEERLKVIEYPQLLVIAALCVDRMLPFYQKFVEDEGWGDFEAVKSILDTVFTASSAGGYLPSDHIDDMTSVCKANTPDSDDFPSAIASCAQDAMVGLYHCLKFARLRQPSDVADVLSSAVSLIDLYIQEVLELSSRDKDLEYKIESNLLMQTELNCQDSDVGKGEDGTLQDQIITLRQRKLLEQIAL